MLPSGNAHKILRCVEQRILGAVPGNGMPLDDMMNIISAPRVINRRLQLLQGLGWIEIREVGGSLFGDPSCASYL